MRPVIHATFLNAAFCFYQIHFSKTCERDYFRKSFATKTHQHNDSKKEVVDQLRNFFPWYENITLIFISVLDIFRLQLKTLHCWLDIQLLSYHRIEKIKVRLILISNISKWFWSELQKQNHAERFEPTFFWKVFIENLQVIVTYANVLTAVLFVFT